MNIKKTLSNLLLILFIIGLTPNLQAEKGHKNTKKADVKKVSREEHQAVRNWANLHKKTSTKKKKIKKQFD